MRGQRSWLRGFRGEGRMRGKSLLHELLLPFLLRQPQMQRNWVSNSSNTHRQPQQEMASCNVFRCVLASIYEDLSVHMSVRPSLRGSVCPSVSIKEKTLKSPEMNHIQDIYRYSNKINTKRTHRCPIGLVSRFCLFRWYSFRFASILVIMPWAVHCSALGGNSCAFF